MRSLSSWLSNVSLMQWISNRLGLQTTRRFKSYKTFCKQACASFGSSKTKAPVHRSRSAVKDLGSRHKWWSDGFARRRHGCSMFGDATGFTGFGLDEIWVWRIWGCRRRQLTSPSRFVSWWKGWPFSFQGWKSGKVSSPFARAPPSLSRRRVSVRHRRRGRGEPCLVGNDLCWGWRYEIFLPNVRIRWCYV